MKILSAIEALCHGGAQTVLVDLALSMPEHEHRVIHFSSANGIATDRAMLDDLRRAGIACLDAHWNSLRNADQRDSVLDGFRPDVVICHWWGNDPWLPWIAEARATRVTNARDASDADTPTFICVLHHANIDAADAYDHYVLVSRSQLGQVARIPTARVHTIPNGVDLARFAPRRARDAARPMVVGRLSNLREGKIPADWVETLASYQIPDTRFVIAGDGALLPTLRDRARELRLERQFSFPGYVPRHEVPALLETFDVFCYVTSTA
ncbi:MAG TPA: glycosyltransferase family 4 protein, partial [Candidatus Binataceae bacterium]